MTRKILTLLKLTITQNLGTYDLKLPLNYVETTAYNSYKTTWTSSN